MRTLVVVPTYNERQNLDNLVAGIRKYAGDAHILIVDDDSPDGTGKLADEWNAKDPDRIFVLHRPGKEGLGRAYVDGFRYALQRNYDFIVQMDADLSHDPSYLPALLRCIEHSDVVLGSRYLKGVNVVNWDFKRLLLSKLASAYVRLVTRMPVSDATGGFKCWRRAALSQIGLEGLFSNGYLFQIETTYRAFRLGLKIEETSIIFYERNLGRSKMHFGIIREAVWGVLKLRFEPEWFHKMRARRVPCAVAPGQRSPA